MGECMDIKTLNKLARVCRKLGVDHLKTSEVEIHLSPAIQPAKRATRRASAPVNESLFNEPDAYTQQQTSLSDNDLLFWSAGDEQ